jgi:hypothetical protein
LVWGKNKNYIQKIFCNFFFQNFSYPSPFRYDVRLYLSSLDEFDNEKKFSYGGNNVNNEDNEADSAEQLEEELCDEQRYADLYVDMKQKELGFLYFFKIYISF